MLTKTGSCIRIQHRSWYVWLKRKYFSHADENKAGSRHKQLTVFNRTTE